MVVTISADQIRQHFRITLIRLRPSQIMPIPVTGHRQRIDRIHLIASCGQGMDPQAPVGFNPNHHVGGIINMVSDELVEGSNPV